MTLVEVMVSLSLFILAMAGIFSLLLHSYTLAARTRLMDESRSVLRTISDPFMRLSSMDEAGTLRTIFEPTTTPTGTGLSLYGTTGDATGLSVTLGQVSDMPVVSRITREVFHLDGSGQPASTPTNTAAGRLLRGRFNVSFTLGEREITQSIVLVRSLP